MKINAANSEHDESFQAKLNSLFERLCPQEIAADGVKLDRSRLIVVVAAALSFLSMIYASIFHLMGSRPATIILIAGFFGCVVSVVSLRVFRSLALSSNLLMANYFLVLTGLACCQGGHGANSLPWYAPAPALALCTLGLRSAACWLVVVVVALFAFFSIDFYGYTFPMSVSVRQHGFLWLVSILGLTLLLSCMAVQYESTSGELRTARVAAESVNKAKSEFLANMSHELRTPMTAILGFTDVLLENLKESESVDAAHTVRKNGEYLLGLINDILDLSKVESGKLEIEQVDCSPHEIVSDVVSLMKVRADSKGLELVERFDGPVPSVICCDPTRLRQILINLVGNAIKFTETGGVQIVVRFQSPSLRFDVVDTGIGIPETKLERIFNPFCQADGSTTRNFGGTGLGLSISKRLVELLGGELSVSSSVGEGSNFSLTIAPGPLDDVEFLEGPARHAPAAPGGPTKEADRPLGGLRLLLVEDGPDNQRLIQFVLKKAGATVELAENGAIGVELVVAAQAEGRPFDVILMDMQMPVLDGYSATRRLRDQEYSGTIIALTAHAMASDRKKCLDAGCDEFSTKPIKREELIGLIKQFAAPAVGFPSLEGMNGIQPLSSSTPSAG